MKPAVAVGIGGVVGVLALGALPGPSVRVGAQVGLAGAALAVLLWEDRRHRQEEAARRHDVDALADALGRWPEATPVTAGAELGPLARALAAATGRAHARLADLEAERAALAEALSRRERRLRDPVVEARRARIAALPALHAVLDGHDCDLRDLQIDRAMITVAPAVAARLVPGLPVELAVTVAGGTLRPRVAAVVAAAPGADEDAPEWVIRFAEALERSEVPAALWFAMAVRRTERVRPPPALPATGTLVTAGDPLSIEVADLSPDGCGVIARVPGSRLGELVDGVAIQLTFPTMGRMAVLSARLRSVAAAPGPEPGWRLGLAFVDGADPERAAVDEWLRAATREPGPPPK